MYPKVKFKLNQTLDIKICLSFLEHKRGGLDFGKGIVAIHSELALARQLSGNRQIETIKKYTNSFYANHGQPVLILPIFLSFLPGLVS